MDFFTLLREAAWHPPEEEVRGLLPLSAGWWRGRSTGSAALQGGSPHRHRSRGLFYYENPYSIEIFKNQLSCDPNPTVRQRHYFPEPTAKNVKALVTIHNEK